MYLLDFAKNQKQRSYSYTTQSCNSSPPGFWFARAPTTPFSQPFDMSHDRILEIPSLLLFPSLI